MNTHSKPPPEYQRDASRIEVRDGKLISIHCDDSPLLSGDDEIAASKERNKTHQGLEIWFFEEGGSESLAKLWHDCGLKRNSVFIDKEARRVALRIPRGLPIVRALEDYPGLEFIARPFASKVAEAPEDLLRAIALAPEGVDVAPTFAMELTPYVSIGKQNAKKREWLYKPVYIRKFIGLTVATGGAGKSSLILVEAVAMACGKNLLGVDPVAPLNVLYWNGEDPQDELERRVEAILAEYGLTNDDLGGRLFIKSGRDAPVRIAEIQDRTGKVRIADPVVYGMIDVINKHQLDVVCIDPFVSSHGVPENSNSDIDLVAKKWADIADRTNCAIQISHHTRTSIEDSRGASALNNAARTRRAIQTMTAAEAQKAGIIGNARYGYFRADMGGSSMVRPTASLDWFRFESVDMDNGESDGDSDSVGVVKPWDYKAASEVTPEGAEADKALAALGDGGPWRADRRADKWAGKPIAAALGLDLAAEGNAAKVAALLKQWYRDCRIDEYEDIDPADRKRKKFYRLSADGDSIDFG
jgi:hypothetical protein